MILFAKFLMLVIIGSLSQAGEVKKQPNKARVARSVASTDDSQEKCVVDYFKCFETHKSEVDLKKCVDASLSSTMPSSNKDRFYSWLIVFDARLNSFGKCSSRKLKEISFFPEATQSFICGRIDLGGVKKEAVFFFKKDKDTEKLWSIYY